MEKKESESNLHEENIVALTDSQKAKIERNRQKALLLRQARLSEESIKLATEGIHKMKLGKTVDTGSGFFLEKEEETGEKVKLKYDAGPVLLTDDILICDKCDKEFMDSYLSSHFDCMVCDKCRADDDSGKYTLITKSGAKDEYLLKDSDLDKREPLLKFIVKKNPHNTRWGDMKLYLELQVKKRAMEIWGDEQGIEEEKENRLERKEKSKEKKYEKKIKQLRHEVRSSLLWRSKESHVHEYGEEVFDEEEDMYSKTCKGCAHVMTYEKM